jgi:hypothetical protein
MAYETFIRTLVSGMQTKCSEEHTSSGEQRRMTSRRSEYFNRAERQGVEYMGQGVRNWHVHYFSAKLPDLTTKLLMLETKTFGDEEKCGGWRNENVTDSPRPMQIIRG